MKEQKYIAYFNSKDTISNTKSYDAWNFLNNWNKNNYGKS